MTNNDPVWLQYEKTVFAFVKALDPTLDINHNVFMPDYDTGHPRQRDLIILAKIAKIFDVRILISCKNKSRKLSEQEIDFFIGEMRSAGVQKGVLFSKKGFTKNAVEKCKKLSISCCQVFDNDRIELPKELSFFASYCFYPIIQVQIKDFFDSSSSIKTWTDFLLLEDDESGEKETIIDHIDKNIQNIVKKIAENPINETPESLAIETSISLLNPHEIKAKIITMISWKIFAAKSTCILGNGIYEYTSNRFEGSFSSPSIDTWSDDPGKGWDYIEKIPCGMRALTASFIFGFYYKKRLLERVGNTEIIRPTIAST